MKSKKTLNIANWLMVLLTLGQVLIGSSASFAEEITSDSTSIVQKDTSSEEQKQVESTQGSSTVTKETESEKLENFAIEDEKSKSENANANDSPKQVNQMPVLKNEDIQTEIDNLLSENGLSIDEAGKFHITNESSYRDNLFEVMQKIDALRQQSKEQARAVLSYGLLLGRGNGVVVVPANENLSAVRFTRNNVTERMKFKNQLILRQIQPNRLNQKKKKLIRLIRVQKRPCQNNNLQKTNLLKNLSNQNNLNAQ